MKRLVYSILIFIGFLAGCNSGKFSQSSQNVEPSKLSNTKFLETNSSLTNPDEPNMQTQINLPVEFFGSVAASAKLTLFTYQTLSGRAAKYWDVELKLSDLPLQRGTEIQKLSAIFGRTESSDVPLVSNNLANYWLSDFLPSRMQALQGHGFASTSSVEWGLLGKSKLDRNSNVDNFVLRPELRKVTNCWSTVYELLRGSPLSFETWFASDRHVVSYLDSAEKNGTLENEDTVWTSFVKELHWQEACFPSDKRFCPQGNLSQKRNENLKRGDMLLVYGKNGLQHAAIYIAPDLYYEKSGAKFDHHLYRIVPFEEIAKQYSDPELRYRYRRPKLQKDLPPPSQAFQRTWNDYETEIWDLMPESLKELGARPSWQPEVGDARDLGIYIPEKWLIKFDENNRAYVNSF